MTVTPALGLRWLIVVVVALLAVFSMIISEVAAIPHLYAWLIVGLCIVVAPWT